MKSKVKKVKKTKKVRKTMRRGKLSYADWKQRMQVVQLALRKGATPKQLMDIGVASKTITAARAYRAPKVAEA